MPKASTTAAEAGPRRRRADADRSVAAILDAARRGLITERTAGEHVAALDERFLEVSAGEYPPEQHEP